jgi:hypothetical protein
LQNETIAVCTAISSSVASRSASTTTVESRASVRPATAASLAPRCTSTSDKAHLRRCAIRIERSALAGLCCGVQRARELPATSAR